MKMPWLNDPKDNNPSVSLTILVVSFLSVLVAGSLQLAGKVESAGIFTEVFYSALALYFGRRLNINNKAFSSDKAEDIAQKVE